MRRTWAATQALGALCAIAAVVGCDSSLPITSDPSGSVPSGGTVARGGYRGVELAAPMPMPSLTLTTTDGKPFNLVTSTTHPITLVFFGYTNCPDVCPLVMSDLTLAYAELPGDVQQETQVLFVTTDPARDTPSVLRTYLDHYNPAFVGLTGSLRRIGVAATDLGVAITGIKSLPNGGYDVGHGAQVIGFAHETAPVIWTPGTPVSDMVADIKTLAGS